MKTIVLKVDVDTFRGTREGVPRLVELFRSRGVNATFLFSLGPDHTGRAIKQVLRNRFMKKGAMRERYDLKTLLYGTLLPGPDIGLRCADLLRSVEAAGFEVGVRAWDATHWQNGIAQADAEWTKQALDQAAERFRQIFGHPAQTHGAAGWQMSRIAYRLEQRMGFSYASDTRGSQPFWPIVEGEPLRCLQIPTTLPTLDELLDTGDATVESMDSKLLRATEVEPEYGHVFTLRAELEGRQWLPAMERLLDGWAEQGYRMICLGELFGMLDTSSLPYHMVELGSLQGGGSFSTQGASYP